MAAKRAGADDEDEEEDDCECLAAGLAAVRLLVTAASRCVFLLLAATLVA